MLMKLHLRTLQALLLGSLGTAWAFLSPGLSLTSDSLQASHLKCSAREDLGFNEEVSRQEFVGTACSLLAITPAAATAIDDDDDDEPEIIDEEPAKPKTVRQAVEEIDSMNYRVPEFTKGLEWVNSPPLTLGGDLRGRIVLLDFWTYACVNCMHVIPLLRRMEGKFGDKPFAVVGIHSAKFSNEKDSANIRQALERYGIKHPVVNDGQMSMWNSVGVSSWPSLALVGPRGNLLGIWEGEGWDDRIEEYIKESLDYFGGKGELNAKALPKEAAPTSSGTALRYPGKVATHLGTGKLAVSDSGHNRLLVLDAATGNCMESIGCGQVGFQDGSFTSSSFNSPQGVAFNSAGDVLYCCDTENHAVRAVDLRSKIVSTVAGTGEQGFDYTGGKKGKDQWLSSPWDVVVHGDGDLLVAMAGLHQIWKVNPKSGLATCYSGTGRERELNAKDRINSAWAQPSGLSIGSTSSQEGKAKPLLLVADSESSSVRSMELNGDGSTATVVGGSGQPDGTNLFAFGDKDGVGAAAKLQHPLAVLSLSNGQVMVADSYNHRIKAVNLDKREVTSVAGAGKPGMKDGAGKQAAFWEPSGLALGDGVVYVSDTNNHLIRTLDVATGTVGTFTTNAVPAPGEQASQQPLFPRRKARFVDLGIMPLSDQIQLSTSLPSGTHFTKGAVSRWRVVGGSAGEQIEGEPSSISLAGMEEGPLELESVVYYCVEDSGVCKMDAVVFTATGIKGAGSSSGSSAAVHEVGLGAGETR
ncbi:unnamed protein product [Chrysoparadoxa australica]